MDGGSGAAGRGLAGSCGRLCAAVGVAGRAGGADAGGAAVSVGRNAAGRLQRAEGEAVAETARSGRGAAGGAQRAAVRGRRRDRAGCGVRGAAEL